MTDVPDTSDLFGPDSTADPQHEFSMQELSSTDLHELIHRVPTVPDDEEMPVVNVSGADGQHHALMRLDHPVRLHVEGSLGDYALAYNARADVKLAGAAGHGVGEGMRSGAVRVRGDVGVGAGASMTGGVLAVHGSAGDRCGAAMRGGNIFVRGNAGDEAGVGALNGMIVIGGHAGENLGDAMNNVTIFIRGQAKSLADGVTEAPLRQREQLRLGMLLIKAAIRGDAKEFRRVVPVALVESEQSQRGELNPKWR